MSTKLIENKLNFISILSKKKAQKNIQALNITIQKHWYNEPHCESKVYYYTQKPKIHRTPHLAEQTKQKKNII